MGNCSSLEEDLLEYEDSCDSISIAGPFAKKQLLLDKKQKRKKF